MTLKVAVIGLGVGEKHIDGFEKNKNCKVVTICDKNIEKLREVSSRYPSKKLCLNPNEIFEDPNIKVVSIATYDDSHCDLILKAINSGKHIFVEKPLCISQKEFDLISDVLTKKPDIKISSNLILRKTPRFITLKNQIDSGEFGEVYYLEGDYDYGRINKIIEGWRGNIPNYSVVHGGAIHLIDLIIWLMGKKVVEVFAFGTNIATQRTSFKGSNDTVASLLKFENGTIAKITANFPCVTPHFHRLSVYGTHKTFQQAHGSNVLIDSRDINVKPTKLSDPYPGTQKGDLIPSFVDSILYGKMPGVNKQEIFDVMAISLAIEESILRGSKIKVDYKKIN